MNRDINWNWRKNAFPLLGIAIFLSLGCGDGDKKEEAAKETAQKAEDELPAGLTPEQAADYIRGFRLGWENAGDDCVVVPVQRRRKLYFLYGPSSQVLKDPTESTRLGERAGRAEARLDFNRFCLNLEKRFLRPEHGGR